MPKAKDAALKALSLDDNLAEAHTPRSDSSCIFTIMISPERKASNKRAIELNPNYATAHQNYGNLVSNSGRFEETFAEFRQALEFDPLSLNLNRAYGERLVFARRYDDAIAQLKKTLELDNGFVSARYSLAAAY